MNGSIVPSQSMKKRQKKTLIMQGKETLKTGHTGNMKNETHTPDPRRLLNFTELSKLAAGHEKSVQRNRIPKKHQKHFNELFKFLESWQERYLK